MSNIKKFLVQLCLCLAFFSLKNISSAQDTTIFTFFDEVSVNVNQSLLFFNNENGRTGFGVGAYATTEMEKVVQWQTGVEYNYYHYFQDYIYNGHSSSQKNIDFFTHVVSIPINLRLVLGNKFNPFIQVGVFFDFPIISKISGIQSSYTANSSGYLTYHEEPFEILDFSGSPKIGMSGALGTMFKIKSYNFGWKAECKFGLIPFYLDPETISNVNGRISFFWCFK